MIQSDALLTSRGFSYSSSSLASHDLVQTECGRVRACVCVCVCNCVCVSGECMAQKPSDKIRVKLLYFAKARELAGISEETIEVPCGSDANAVIAQALRAHSQLEQLGTRSAIAVNLEYVPRAKDGAVEGEALKDGDEVAFFPPISGG